MNTKLFFRTSLAPLFLGGWDILQSRKIEAYLEFDLVGVLVPELGQEPIVCAPEQPNVGDVEEDHGQAF